MHQCNTSPCISKPNDLGHNRPCGIRGFGPTLAALVEPCGLPSFVLSETLGTAVPQLSASQKAVSLRVRHEQLTRLDFHQLDCGLAGYPHVVLDGSRSAGRRTSSLLARALPLHPLRPTSHSPSCFQIPVFHRESEARSGCRTCFFCCPEGAHGCRPARGVPRWTSGRGPGLLSRPARRCRPDHRPNAEAWFRRHARLRDEFLASITLRTSQAALMIDLLRPGGPSPRGAWRPISTAPQRSHRRWTGTRIPSQQGTIARLAPRLLDTYNLYQSSARSG
jgi:hypothetical protein